MFRSIKINGTSGTKAEFNPVTIGMWRTIIYSWIMVTYGTMHTRLHYLKKKKHEPLFDLYESRVLDLTSFQKIFPFFHYLNYKTKSEMAIPYATLQSFGRFDN